MDALVVTSKARVTAEVLGRFDGRLVLTTTSGWDHIDVDAAVAAGIEVGRSPLARRDAVVEHALACLMGLSRALPAQLEAARVGRWARGELPKMAPWRLQDRPVLLVGLGVIGRRCASFLHAMDVEVWGVDPRGVPDGVRAVDLDAALPDVGAVSLHCSLSATSHGLLHAARVGRMAKDAVLVNTSRGDVLDVASAVAAVSEGRLKGLATDVFPHEPYPDLERASQHPAVWLTPHASGYAVGLGRRVADEVVAGLEAWKAGRAQPHGVLGFDRS